GRDRGVIRAIESDLGEAVFGDLHGGARLLHLPSQNLHLGHGEAGIVSDDDDVRGLEHGLERVGEVLLFRSIHVDPLLLGGLGRAAWLPLPPVRGVKAEGRDDACCPVPRRGCTAQVLRFEPTGMPRTGLPRLCRPARIKPPTREPLAPAVSDRTWPLGRQGFPGPAAWPPGVCCKRAPRAESQYGSSAVGRTPLTFGK